MERNNVNEKKPEKLKELYQRAIDRINAYADSPGYSLIVAVSRKGLHLMDAIEGKLKLKDSDWITEYALPYLLPYNETTKVIKRVFLIDDIVLKGSTFQRVKLYILDTLYSKGYDLSDIDFIPVPLVVLGDANGKTSYAISAKDVDKFTIISNEDVPLFSQLIVDDINWMHKPFDVEIYQAEFDLFDNKGEIDLTSCTKKLCELLETRFPGTKIPFYKTKRYSPTSGIETENFSVVLDDIFNIKSKYTQPEFSKIRIYYDPKDHKLRVSTYCINTIDDSKLRENTPLFDDALRNGLWYRIYRKYFSSNNDLKPGIVEVLRLFDIPNLDNKYFEDSLIREFRYQHNKALVLLVNFIYSYYLADSIKGEICQAFNATVGKNEIKDSIFKMLFGPIEGKEIANVLAEMSYDVFNAETYMSNEMPYRYFPSTYQLSFEEALYTRLAYNKAEGTSVENALSAEFGAMHNEIEVPQREYNGDVFGRLRFGENYRSLNQRLKPIVKSEEFKFLMKFLHSGIDYRIDHGSVVPNYVRLSKADATGYYWTRLFRSGINDDPRLDYVMRNLLYIITPLLKHEPFIAPRPVAVNFLLIFIYAYISKLLSLKSFTDKTLFGKPIRTIYDEKKGYYIMQIKLSDNEEWRGLLDYAVETGFLNFKNGIYLISNKNGISNLEGTNNFRARIEDAVNNISTHVLDKILSPLYDTDILREILNWYLFDNQKFITSFEDLRTDIMSKIDPDAALTKDSVESIIGNYNQMVSMMPSTDMFKRHEISNELYAELPNLPNCTDVDDFSARLHVARIIVFILMIYANFIIDKDFLKKQRAIFERFDTKLHLRVKIRDKQMSILEFWDSSFDKSLLPTISRYELLDTVNDLFYQLVPKGKTQD